MKIDFNLNMFVSLLPLLLVAVILIGSVMIYLYKKAKRKNFLPVEKEEIVETNTALVQEDQQQPQESTQPVIVTEPITSPVQITPHNEARFLFEQFINHHMEQSGFSKTDSNAECAEGISCFSIDGDVERAEMGVISIWKQGFIKGRIEWAKSHQLVNYRRFQNDQCVPLYLAVGVGGSPSDPEKLSLIPLNGIRSNVLLERQVQAHLLNNQLLSGHDAITTAPTIQP
jgi:hypothetical protein